MYKLLCTVFKIIPDLVLVALEFTALSAEDSTLSYFFCSSQLGNDSLVSLASDTEKYQVFFKT